MTDSEKIGKLTEEVAYLSEQVSNLRTENRLLRAPATHLNIAQMQHDVHSLAREKGWYDKDDGKRNVGELIALIHSELSEALEEWRKGSTANYSNGGKPEGFGIELADAVIRIADLCEYLGINLERCIIEKHAYNKTRPYRHGNKAA